MDPTLSDATPDRRGFGRVMIALAAGAGLTSTAVADEPKKEEKPEAKPPTLAEINEQLIRQRFGQHLNEDQIKRLSQRVQAQRSTAEALKKIPLKNSDEPAFVFSAEN
jgi:hypothetical protein